eukprot:EG_transcript_3516
MLGKLSGRLVNLQTGLVEFLEETTGESDLKGKQPTSPAPDAGSPPPGVPTDATEAPAAHPEVHTEPPPTTVAEPAEEAAEGRRSCSVASLEHLSEARSSPETREAAGSETPADPEDYRRLYLELQQQAALEAEQWAALRTNLHRQIEDSLLREEAAQAECSALREQLQAPGGDRGRASDGDRRAKDLEQRLQAALKGEAHYRLEAETARETLESLKAEFHKTQQKEERQLAIIRKDRDELRKKLKALEKKAEQPGPMAATEEVQLLKEEGEKLSREVGLKNEKIKELLRGRKELEAKADDLAAAVAELQGRERLWAETRLQCEELTAQCRAQAREAEGTAAALRAAEDQVRQLKARLLAADNSRDAQKVELSREWEEREAALLRELDDARHSLEAISRDADARLTAALRELEDAHRRAIDAERRVVELTNAVPEAMEPLQQRIAALEAQLAPYLEGRFDKDQRIAQLQSSAEQLQARLRESEAELRSTVEKQLGLQKALKEAQEQAAASRAEAQRVARQVLEAQGARDGLQQQLEEQRRQLAATLAQLRAAQQELAALQDSHRQLLLQRASPSPPPLLAPAKPPPPVPSPVGRPPLPVPEEPPSSAGVPEPYLQTSLQQVNEAKDHLQKELYKYIVENTDLKKRLAQVEQMKARHADLSHRYNVLLELMGEKEEECQELRTKLSATRVS